MAKGLLQTVTWRSGALVVSETMLIIGAVIAAVFLRLGHDAWEMVAREEVLPKALLIAYVCQICLYYGDLYETPRLTLDRRDFLVRIIHALGVTSLVLSAIYFWFPDLIIGRGVFAVACLLVLLVVVGWRLTFAWWTRHVGPRQRLLLVGTSRAGVALAKELHDNEDLGVEIVGFVDHDPGLVGTPLFNPSIIGTLEDIPAVVRARAVDRVVVNMADARGKLPMHKLLEMRIDGVVFDHLTSVYEEYTGKIAVENLRPSWLIFSSGFRKSLALRSAKRVLDVVAAAVGLLASAPVLLILAVLVKLSSKGPVFYAQQRVGQHGHVFTVYKVRSMRQDAEVRTGAVWALRDDPRVTWLGRIMRRARLDEIPQFWNVLLGNMSLVGPRPERPEFVRSLTEQIPFYGLRHVVKPGLTGWAQVRYTYGASVEDAMEKLQYDLFYIKNMSLALDLFIVFETIKTVLLRRGAA